MTGTITYEPFALIHETCYPGGELKLKWDEIREAEVGKVWSVEDQDCYPNRTQSWTTTYTVVYKDKNGVCIKKDENGELELMWFQYS